MLLKSLKREKTYTMKMVNEEKNSTFMWKLGKTCQDVTENTNEINIIIIYRRFTK